METCCLKLFSCWGRWEFPASRAPLWGCVWGASRRLSPEPAAPRLPSASALWVTQGGLPAEEVI